MTNTATETARLVTAEQLAERLAVGRAWVYQNSAQLGAVRLGTGPKARIRFDPSVALQRLNAPRTREAPTVTPTRRARKARPAAGRLSERLGIKLER